MAILPVDVRRPLDRLRDRLHSAFERLRPARGGDLEREGGAQARPVFSGPALDVEETDDEVLVRAELPGLQPHEFTVEATGERLIIRGEKGEEREQHGRGFYRLERRVGAFVRSVALPCEVDTNRTNATYRDGVLRVSLPKTAAAKARRVHVRLTG
ncbi:MAG: Hsp20/alpha crystallin family protein [Chloroflexota bacterium]|nr:Hsp20/alpha crystallin family protein [Chloroflexota bacterium]